MEQLYNKHFKTLMKETEEGLEDEKISYAHDYANKNGNHTKYNL